MAYFQACNYQPSALVDDGTCDFASCIEEEPVAESVDLSALEDFVAAPTKLNVFYRGLENPLEISVPGITGDMLNVSIDGNHSIKKLSDGNYVVTLVKMGQAEPTVIRLNCQMAVRKSFRPRIFASYGDSNTRNCWGKRHILDDEISTSEMHIRPLRGELSILGLTVPEVKSVRHVHLQGRDIYPVLFKHQRTHVYAEGDAEKGAPRKCSVFEDVVVRCQMDLNKSCQ